MNSFFESMKFTMQLEMEGKLPFLDIRIMRRASGCDILEPNGTSDPREQDLNEQKPPQVKGQQTASNPRAPDLEDQEPPHAKSRLAIAGLKHKTNKGRQPKPNPRLPLWMTPPY